MGFLNGILRAARTNLGKLGLGFIILAGLVIVAWMNPIRESDAPKTLAKAITYDQQISIPKIPGGASSMAPLVNNPGDLASKVGVVSRWTAIENGDDPGQLLIDLTSIHIWRKIERTGLFQYIPRARTIDENRNRPILYELVNDTFECAEGMAEKLSLVVYYEDGGQQTYYPWRYPGANEWIPVRQDTTLSREMKFVCAVQLTAESTSAGLDADSIFGTWQVEDGAQGRIAAGPIVISETQVAWTAPDSHKCVSNYQLASRSTGSTFPGGPAAGDKSVDAYATFTLDLKGPHLESCSQKMSSLTISLPSTQRDLAYFTAFFLAPQAHGTMRRVPSAAALKPY